MCKIFTYFLIQNFSSINIFVKLHLIVWKSFSFIHPSPPQLCSSILPPGIWSLENYGCVMNWPIVAVTPKQLYDNETITVFLSQLIERKLVFSAGVWSQVRVRKDLWVTDFYLRVDFCFCLRTSPRAKPFIYENASVSSTGSF